MWVWNKAIEPGYCTLDLTLVLKYIIVFFLDHGKLRKMQVFCIFQGQQGKTNVTAYI